MKRELATFRLEKLGRFLMPALRNGEIGSLIGAACSGKSFILGHLLRQVEAKGLRCLVACSTHKSARVCREFLARTGAEARVCAAPGDHAPTTPTGFNALIDLC